VLPEPAVGSRGGICSVAGYVVLRDDPFRGDPHHYLAGDSVAAADLLGAVLAYVAGADLGREAQQLTGVAPYLADPRAARWNG
jgi:hypothetical protein